MKRNEGVADLIEQTERQPQRSTNGHEVFFLSMRLYAPFTNVEAGHWLRLDPDNPFHVGTSRSVFRGANRQYMLVKQVLTARPIYLEF